MSDLLSGLPKHLFFDQDCFPMGVISKLSMVNRDFNKFITSPNSFNQYWDRVISIHPSLSQEGKVSYFYRKGQDGNFTIIDLKMIDLGDRKIMKVDRFDFSTNFESIRYICHRLKETIRDSFGHLSGRDTDSFFYQDNVRGIQNSMYRMVIDDYESIQKPGKHLDNISLSDLIKVIMSEQLPLDVLIALIKMQTPLITVFTTYFEAFVHFKNTGLTLLTSQHVLSHPLFKKNPTDLMYLLASILALQSHSNIFVPENGYQAVLDSITQALDLITTLTSKYHFSLIQLINCLEHNLQSNHTTFVYENLVNFTMALETQFITPDYVHKKLHMNKLIPLHHYTAAYLQCLEKHWIHPKGHFSLDRLISDDFIMGNQPHPAQSLYLNYLAQISTASEKLNPLHLPAKNILDAFIDVFLMKPHDPEAHIYTSIDSYRDSYPFLWQVNGTLEEDSLYRFYLSIQQTMRTCFENTPSFDKKELYISHYLLRTKPLLTLVNKALFEFMQKRMKASNDFSDFQLITREFTTQLSETIQMLITSESARHFAKLDLKKALKSDYQSSYDFRDITQLKAYISPMIFSNPFNLTASFQEKVDQLATMIHGFLTEMIPWHEVIKNQAPTFFKNTIHTLIKNYHFYLMNFFFNVVKGDMDLVKKIHESVMQSIRRGSFDIIYHNFLKLTYKYFLIDRATLDNESDLHHINMLFLKITACLELKHIELEDFNRLIQIIVEHRKKTRIVQLYPMQTTLDTCLTDITFKKLLAGKITSSQWLTQQSKLIGCIFRLPQEQLEDHDSDMEMDDD